MTARMKYYFQISPTSGVPIYRQIIDQINTMVATGRLKEGTFIPSVRQVAKELEVNPMTVSKAYSLLEREGVLEMVRGQGMKISRVKESKRHLAQRESDMIPLLREVVIKGRQLSLSQDKILELLRSLWKE